MSLVSNPFKPSAGSNPPLLVGRQEVIADLESGIAEGPGAPGRVTILTGARGVGKTVMLSEAGVVALRNGWISIDETASPGLIGRVTEHVDTILDPWQPGRK